MGRRARLLPLTGLLLAFLGALGIAGPPGYDRREWMPSGWDPGPVAPCRSVREEVLARDALRVVWDDEGCRLVRGLWSDPYTGARLTAPADLDVDHVVSLHEAHRAGGWAWSPARKRAFAQDLAYRRHLLAVEAGENRRKGDRTLAEWRPPRVEAWCEVAEATAAIKGRWGLTWTAAERAALAELLATC
jgi:hypothetical protein